MYDDAQKLNFSYVNVSVHEPGAERLFEGTVQQRLADLATALVRALYAEVQAEGRPYAGDETADVLHVSVRCPLSAVRSDRTDPY